MKKQLIIAAILLAAVTSHGQMFAQMFGQSWTPASLGPIAWYKFEGNVLDSASTNNGTWAGGGGTYTNGLNGQCANFADNTDGLRYISCGVPLIAITNWSVEAWIYMSSTNAIAFPAAQYTAGQTGRFNLRIESLVCSQFGGSVYQSTARVSPNVWTHVVWGCSNGSNGVFYVNGAAAGTTDYSGSRVTQLSVFTIGGLGATSAQSPWTHLIDDVRVYNRTLTPAEITQLYNWRQP